MSKRSGFVKTVRAKVWSYFVGAPCLFWEAFITGERERERERERESERERERERASERERVDIGQLPEPGIFFQHHVARVDMQMRPADSYLKIQTCARACPWQDFAKGTTLNEHC